MARKKQPEPIYLESIATPKRARVYVQDIGHKLRDYGQNNNLPEVEAMGAKLMMFMRYEDSLDGFVRTDRALLHPLFEEYASALVVQANTKSMFSKEAISILEKEFEPKASPFMPNGYSLWSDKRKEPYPA